MPKRPPSERQPNNSDQGTRPGRGARASHSDLVARVAELEAALAAREQERTLALARAADLEAQLVAYRNLQTVSSSARLSMLLAISAALLVTHEIEAIMHLVVHEGAKLFPGTSGALLFLADTNVQRLVLRATSGKTPTGLTLLPGQGVAGRAFLAPRAMLMVGPELEAALSDLDEEQISHVSNLLDVWPPTSALLAPLRIESQRLGALVIYGGFQAHLFLPRDLPFVQGLADLAAVAIVEHQERLRAVSLQRDLVRSQSLHAEAQSRLDAAQAQLLQSAKLVAVGELAASVAHEINNPLYAARNSLYLVEQDLPPESSQRTFLSIAQGELGRIARIITRMRDFYRPTRAELEPTNINNLLLETVDLVQTHLRHGQVSVVHALAPDLPLLVAHTDQLRQVFLNMMLNACDAMPSGGTLRLETRLLPPVDSLPPTVEICIADTGTGIPPEHLPHLFEPFYTTKAQGTGLGLAISMHIITQHGGNIVPESTVGVGTTFTITLPVSVPDD